MAGPELCAGDASTFASSKLADDAVAFTRGNFDATMKTLIEGAIRGLRARGTPDALTLAAECDRLRGRRVLPEPRITDGLMAAICQGVYKRALDGNASNPEKARTYGDAVKLLAGLAVRLIDGKE
mgnify:CR=1 FL=1